MATIGSINVAFNADTQGLAQGTKQGEGFIDSFTNTIGKGVASSLGSLTSLGAGSVGVGVFMGNMATSAVHALGDMAKGFINLGIEAGKTVVGMVKEGLDLADGLNDQAAKINTSLESYSLLRYQVKLLGGDVEAILPSLTKLSKNIASGASKGTINDVLKLDNNALAALDDPIEQLKRIRTALDELPTHGAKLSASMQLAGKGASGILPYLTADSEQLAKLEQRARELGAVFSSFDAERIGLANDSFDDLGFAMEGLKVILAGEIAPLITVAVNDTIQWAKSMGDFRTIAISALESLAFGLDVAVNYGNILFGVFALLSTPVLAFATGLTFIVEMTLRAISLIPGIGKAFKGAADMATQARKDVAAFSNGTVKAGLNALQAPGSDIQGWLGNVKTKADQLDKSLGSAKKTATELGQKTFNEAFGKITEKLDFDIDTHGLDDAQKKIAETLKEAGLDYKKFFEPDGFDSGNWLYGPQMKQQIDDYKKQVRSLQDLDFGKKQLEEFNAIGKKAFEDTQLPVEKLIDEMSKLRDAFGAGSVANDDFRKQQKKLKKDFLEGLGVEVESPFEKMKKDLEQLQTMKDKLNLSDKEFAKAKDDIAGKFGQSLGVDFETPLEKMQKELQALDDAFRAGSIDENKLAMGRGQVNAKYGQNKLFAEAVDVGTQSARDVTLKQIYGTESTDPIDKVADLSRKQLDELKDIAKKLADNKTPASKVIKM